MPTFNYGPGNHSLAIPGNAANIVIVCKGARGGTGGRDAGAYGGVGGNATGQYFNATQNFSARNFDIYVGGQGGNGTNNQAGAPGGSGGYSVAGSGGPGGPARSAPYSGGGGGGGGASGIFQPGVGWLVAMGGSGGGGGASHYYNGYNGGSMGSGAGAAGPFGVANGSPGPGLTGGDGGGGGGGGGGVGGGGAGNRGTDKSVNAGGGGAGGSAFRSGYISNSYFGVDPGGYAGFISVSYDLYNPSIQTFYASPNPQTSSSGSPSYATTLTWGTTDTDNCYITSSAGETFSGLATTGSYNITNGPQSNAQGTSPASRSYTLYASLGSIVVQSTITVNWYNDNVPTTSWTTSFNNLEPNTQYDLQLGSISGVDMPLASSTNNGLLGRGTGVFGSSFVFNQSDTVYLRVNTLDFNTDTTGATGMYGYTNTKNVTVTIGASSFNVAVTTKAPRIGEDFDFAPVQDEFPFPDIDVVTNSPTSYLATGSITADDIEIQTEIKTDSPDAQVRINGGSWQSTRSI